MENNNQTEDFNNDKPEFQASNPAAQSIDDQLISQPNVEIQPTASSRKFKMGNILKILLWSPFVFLALIITTFIIPSYSFVQTLANLAFFGGPVVALVLGIIISRTTIQKMKKRTSAQSTDFAAPKTSGVQAIIVGILVFIGIFVSYAVTFFILALFLSQRACELSGSSKCY